MISASTFILWYLVPREETVRKSVLTASIWKGLLLSILAISRAIHFVASSSLPSYLDFSVFGRVVPTLLLHTHSSPALLHTLFRCIFHPRSFMSTSLSLESLHSTLTSVQHGQGQQTSKASWKAFCTPTRNTYSVGSSLTMLSLRSRKQIIRSSGNSSRTSCTSRTRRTNYQHQHHFQCYNNKFGCQSGSNSPFTYTRGCYNHSCTRHISVSIFRPRRFFHNSRLDLLCCCHSEYSAHTPASSRSHSLSAVPISWSFCRQHFSQVSYWSNLFS